MLGKQDDVQAQAGECSQPPAHGAVAGPVPPSASAGAGADAPSGSLSPEWGWDQAASSEREDASAAGQPTLGAEMERMLRRRPAIQLAWVGALPYLRLRGAFARRLGWALRMSVACLLSLSLSVAPATESHITVGFLSPVVAVLVCSTSIGASINQAGQVIKGTLYAAVFGWITALCGVNYANDSRVATLLLLFAFCAWAKYCLPAPEMTTKKLATGLCASVLLSQLNSDLKPSYAWEILGTACVGSAAGVIASMTPFPNSAMQEAEDRWAHALLQTQHVFHLLMAAFSCTSQAQLEARMLHTRIEQALGHMLANRDAIRLRVKESGEESPIVFYRFVFGTMNNYAWTRFQQQCDTLSHCYQYFRCMQFALCSLPYDTFHARAMHYLREDLHAVSLGLTRWLHVVSSSRRTVHRMPLLADELAAYALAVARLFERYQQFRADLYFHGNLFLVDLMDGSKAVLRQTTEDDVGVGPEEAHRTLRMRTCSNLRPPSMPNVGAAASSPSPAVELELAMLRSDAATPKGDTAGAGAETLSKRLHPSGASHASDGDVMHIRFHAATESGDDEEQQKEEPKPGAGSQPGDAHAHATGMSPSYATAPPPVTAPLSASDLTWTSDDVISLNFFFFQIKEFTKRALKFAAEPGEDARAQWAQAEAAATMAQAARGVNGEDNTQAQDADADADADTNDLPVRSSSPAPPVADPLAEYHLSSPLRLPHFLWRWCVSYAITQRALLREACTWNRRRALEALKFALAIVIASFEQLAPSSWPTIYERTHHGWWAAVTVAFTMSDNLGTHFSSMSLRVLGTMVGAVMGYIAAAVCHDNRIALVALLTLWNAATTYCRADPNTRFQYAYLVAGFTAIVVAVGADPTVAGEVSAFAFVRIQQTLIGVLVGLAVHSLIFPLRASTLLHQELLANLTRIKQTFSYSFGKYQQRAAQFKSRASRMGSGEFRNMLLQSSPMSMPHQDRMMEEGEVHVQMTEMPPQVDGPRASLSTASSSFAIPPPAPPSPPLQLNPAHSFRSLGAKLFGSLDSQSSLRNGAADEPTLWRTPFPAGSYARVTDIQRNIALYLYCMDLALQRIAQSNARFNRFADSVAMASDLEVHFARLKGSVSTSLGQITRGLRTYDPDASASVPPSDDDREASDSLMQGSAGLLSQQASLEELNVKYKQWIDKRVLAKRSMGLELAQRHRAASPAGKQHKTQSHDAHASSKDEQQQQQQHESGSAAHASSLDPSAPLPRMLPARLTVSAAAAATSANLVSPLLPISLYTPLPDTRPFEHPAHMFTIQPLSLPPPAVLTPQPSPMPSPALADHPLPQVASFSFTRGGVGSAPAAPSASPPAAAHTGAAPPTAAPRPGHSAPSLAMDAVPAVGQLAATFTRSLDILALNAFLYATKGSATTADMDTRGKSEWDSTRGWARTGIFVSLLTYRMCVCLGFVWDGVFSLIREIMSLSQAVRVLLHMRRPGMFEEAF